MSVVKLNIEKQEDERYKLYYQSQDGSAGTEYFDTFDEAQAFGATLSDTATNDQELEESRAEAKAAAEAPDTEDTESLPQDATVGGTTEHHPDARPDSSTDSTEDSEA